MLTKHLFLNYDSDAQNAQPKTDKDWADIENAAIDTEFLDISCNAFSKIAFTQQLTTLRVLEVSYNTTAISELMLDAALLPNLQHLYAYQAKLQKISFKGIFEKLETLHLAENELQTFELGNFPQLKTLYLYKNPIQNIPKEIFDKTQENVCESVKSYLESKQEGELVYLHQAKMILIGNENVGKSSVMYRLKNKEGNLPERKETQGIALGLHTLEHLPPNITGLENEIRFDLSIWDFGGQSRYREVQQLFCSRKALYIFVTAVDDTIQNQSYIGSKYWLSMAKTFGHDPESKKDSPVIFVLNKCDKEGKTNINEDEHNVFGNIHEFVKISCNSLYNFEQLEKEIQTALPKIGASKEDVFHQTFSKKWFNVKEYLESRRNENHISLTEYQAACKNEGMSEIDAATWLDYLDKIGELIYFKNNSELKDFIILNPLWVRNAIYQVLEYENIKHKNGKLEFEYFQLIWEITNGQNITTTNDLEIEKGTTYTKEEHKKLLAFMLASKFCYKQIDEDENEFYLIPSLFSTERPKSSKNIETNEYKLRFVYSPLIPAGTVNKLIVDLHENIYKTFKWKEGCILNCIDNGIASFAEVQEKWEENAVYVSIGKQSPDTVYKLIHGALTKLNEELKNAKFLTNLSFEVQVLDEEDNEYIPWKIAKKNPDLQKYGWIEGKYSVKTYSKEYFKLLVEENKIREAIKELLVATKKNNQSDLHNKVILHSGRFKENEKINNGGMLHNNDYLIELNSIRHTLLNYIEEYKEE